MNTPCNPRIRAHVKAFKPVDHYGIGFNDPTTGELLIAHNTPSKGGVSIDTAEEFFRTRFFKEATCTNVPTERLLAYADKHSHRPFNVLNFNCEHFAFGLTGQPQSPQIVRWLVGTIVVATLAILWLRLHP